MGLATYFRKFVNHFSETAGPLHNLSRKDVPWSWTPVHQAAFDAIKQMLTTAPVLALPDQTPDAAPYIVYTDASLVALGAILTQNGRPVAYESRALLPAERNYSTTEQEQLAVVHALRTWHCYLEGLQFTVVTDHNPLVYLQTQPHLSRRQAG